MTRSVDTLQRPLPGYYRQFHVFTILTLACVGRVWPKLLIAALRKICAWALSTRKNWALFLPPKSNGCVTT